jgi:hypothetical protein
MGKTVVVITWLNPNKNISMYPGILKGFPSPQRNISFSIPRAKRSLIGDPGNQTVSDIAGNPVVVREPSIEIIEDDARRRS